MICCCGKEYKDYILQPSVFLLTAFCYAELLYENLNYLHTNKKLLCVLPGWTVLQNKRLYRMEVRVIEYYT